jgi:hypothetical protein
MGDEDPRTDRHPDDGTPGKYPQPPGKTEPAPGGLGNEPDTTKPSSNEPKPFPPSKSA